MLDLYQLGLHDVADKIWRKGLKGLAINKIQQYAIWATNKNIGYPAIYANGLIAGARGNLEARFPVNYRQYVDKAAYESSLSKTLLWSVIRRESLFQVDAESYANAKGLMQLLPGTAKFIASKYNVKDSFNLFNPEDNIKLGALYLEYLSDRFNGNFILGLAAYNAGQGNVKRWMPSINMTAEQWIETMPYSETREYVKGILSYMTVYENYILNDHEFKMSALMPEIIG